MVSAHNVSAQPQPSERLNADDVAKKRKLLALVDSIIRLPITYDQAVEAVYIATRDLRHNDGNGSPG